MEKISFKDLEEKMGGELTIAIDVNGKEVIYKQKLVGMDPEFLIFQEDDKKHYVSKYGVKRIISYN